jgi:hypothetical protein
MRVEVKKQRKKLRLKQRPLAPVPQLKRQQMTVAKAVKAVKVVKAAKAKLRQKVKSAVRFGQGCF